MEEVKIDRNRVGQHGVGRPHPTTAYRGLASTTDKANRLDSRPVDHR
jgi:hypothetical protein